MNKKIHVLWIASWYPSKTNPFFASFNRRWAFANANFDKVTVLAPEEVFR